MNNLNNRVSGSPLWWNDNTITYKNLIPDDSAIRHACKYVANAVLPKLQGNLRIAAHALGTKASW